MKKSVLLNCPTYDKKKYCLKEWIGAVKNLSYPCDILLADNSDTDEYASLLQSLGCEVIRTPALDNPRTRVVAARNALRKRFLDGGWSHFFSLEQDVIPPKDAIERLLGQKKDVVAGLYHSLFTLKGVPRVRPLMWKAVDTHLMEFMRKEAKTPGLYPVRGTGLGCIMISREVLEKIEFRVVSHGKAFDDLPFCTDAIAQGYPVFLDSSIVCRHIILYEGQYVDIGLTKESSLELKEFQVPREFQ